VRYGANYLNIINIIIRKLNNYHLMCIYYDKMINIICVFKDRNGIFEANADVGKI
jgi:hypothetical protein